MAQLTGKIAIVTSASLGIDVAACGMMARAAVAVTDVLDDNEEETAARSVHGRHPRGRP